MAVVKVPQAAKLVLKVQTGTSESGNPVYRMRTYQNLKTDALDADIHAIGQGIASLQQYPVNAIVRVDEGNLIVQ